MTGVTCELCFVERKDGERDYNPFRAIQGDPNPGWYSGDDGEMCGPCVMALMHKANS